MAFAVGFSLAILAPALANNPPLDAKLETLGWRLFSHSNWPPARFSLTDSGAIRVSTDNSTALVYRAIPEKDRTKRYLSWRWQVERSMPPTNITVKGGDDRPIAMHVWFVDDADRLSVWDRLTNSVLETIFGIPISGKVVTYVWGGLGRRHDTQENPHIGPNSSMIVLRPGATPTGRWFDERVDIIADFERAFGYRPVGQKIISIAADSEDTMTRSAALVANITFSN